MTARDLKEILDSYNEVDLNKRLVICDDGMQPKWYEIRHAVGMPISVTVKPATIKIKSETVRKPKTVEGPAGEDYVVQLEYRKDVPYQVEPAKYKQEDVIALTTCLCMDEIH